MEDIKIINIDEALKRLEDINQKLSENDISLDDSISLYNEGTILAAQCQDQLKGVEKKLQLINAEE